MTRGKAHRFIAWHASYWQMYHDSNWTDVQWVKGKGCRADAARDEPGLKIVGSRIISQPGVCRQRKENDQ